MSCCNLREYLPPKKDIKEFSSIAEALEALPPPGFGTGVYTDEAEMFERFDRGHLRGIGWTQCKYKFALFEVRVGRAPFEVGAPFQVGELFFGFKLD